MTERGVPDAPAMPLRPVTVKVTLATVVRRRFDSEAEQVPVVPVVHDPDAPVEVVMLTTTPDCGVPAPLSTVSGCC